MADPEDICYKYGQEGTGCCYLLSARTATDLRDFGKHSHSHLGMAVGEYQVFSIIVYSSWFASRN